MRAAFCGYIVAEVRVFVFVSVSLGVIEGERVNMINDLGNTECT